MEVSSCIISSSLSYIFLKKKKTTISDIEFDVYSSINEAKNALQNIDQPSVINITNELLISESNIPDSNFKYLVVNKHGKTILFAWFQIFTLTYKNFNSLQKNTFFNGVLTYLLKLKKIKLLISGNSLKSYDKGYFFDNEAINEKEAIEICLSAMDKISSQQNITAVIFKEQELEPESKNLLVEKGYTQPMEDIVMNLDIKSEWLNFNDYQKDLSRKYASRSKKIKTAISDLKLEKLSAIQVTENAIVIDKLLRDVIQNQSFSLCNPPSSYFIEMINKFPEIFHVYAYFHEDELVAFYSAFVNENTFDIQFVGFEYRLNEIYQLYFNLMFNGLETAIQLKKKTLRLGRTSLDAKANLGAQPHYVNSFIKVSHPHQWALELFTCYFASNENNKWKERNPLKQNIEVAKEVEAFV